MAGIGFRFREIIDEGSYLGAIKGYLYSSVFAAGPWILTMTSISALNAIAPPEIHDDSLVTFRALISYIYAASLILTGTFQLALVRYLADRLYEKDRQEIMSLFVGSSFLFTFLSLAAGSVFLSYNSAGAEFKIMALLLFATVSLIWNGMSFLTAIKDYAFIIFIFSSGTVVSIALCLILKKTFGLNGYVLGYFLGQFYIFSGMAAEITREFFSLKGASYYFLRYFKPYFTLIVSGFAYNAAIWVDKLLIWNMSSHETYLNNFRINARYDTAVFVAYLTIIPALGYFFAKIETGFYELYKNYFACILNKESLGKIRSFQRKISESVDSSVLELIKIQGAITLLCYVNSDYLMKTVFYGNEFHVITFKYAIAGVFFHVLMLFVTIFMMYFEFYKPLLAVSLLFLATNSSFTYYSIVSGANLASGYLFASMISFLTAFILFKINIRKLVFYTFVSQPVLPSVEETVLFDSLKFISASGRAASYKDPEIMEVDFSGAGK